MKIKSMVDSHFARLLLAFSLMMAGGVLMGPPSHGITAWTFVSAALMAAGMALMHGPTEARLRRLEELTKGAHRIAAGIRPPGTPPPLPTLKNDK